MNARKLAVIRKAARAALKSVLAGLAELKAAQALDSDGGSSVTKDELRAVLREMCDALIEEAVALIEADR